MRANELSLHASCNVFLLQYRGYGYSEGKPSMQGIKNDALAGLEYIQSREDVDPRAIYLMGHSLGGAVALSLATRHAKLLAQQALDDQSGTGGGRRRRYAIRGIILENTFWSLKRLVQDISVPMYGWMHLLVGRGLENWDNAEELQRFASETRNPAAVMPGGVGSPTQHFPSMLFLLGAKDELFPQEHMRDLFKQATQACRHQHGGPQAHPLPLAPSPPLRSLADMGSMMGGGGGEAPVPPPSIPSSPGAGLPFSAPCSCASFPMATT